MCLIIVFLLSPLEPISTSLTLSPALLRHPPFGQKGTKPQPAPGRSRSPGLGALGTGVTSQCLITELYMSLLQGSCSRLLLSISLQRRGRDSPCTPVHLALPGVLPDFEDAITRFSYIYCECCCIYKEQCPLSSLACCYFLRKSQHGIRKVKMNPPTHPPRLQTCLILKFWGTSLQNMKNVVGFF